MKKIKLVFLFMMVFMLLTACSSTDERKTTETKKPATEEQVELTVSAAASLQDALTDITAKYEEEHHNIKITYNFGASGALQQQISQGAPVDLFFSAAESNFDQLVNERLIDQDSGIDLIGNEVVLVVPKDSENIKTFEDLTNAEKISIGTPESVPAGKYAKKTLENLNLWSSLESKMVYAKDVRQVLTYVETDNVDAGIVYKTDALISSDVKIIDTADENTHGSIIYLVGIINTTPHLEEAKQFYNYLQSEESMKILTQYGFLSLE